MRSPVHRIRDICELRHFVIALKTKALIEAKDIVAFVTVSAAQIRQKERNMSHLETVSSFVPLLCGAFSKRFCCFVPY